MEWCLQCPTHHSTTPYSSSAALLRNLLSLRGLNPTRGFSYECESAAFPYLFNGGKRPSYRCFGRRSSGHFIPFRGVGPLGASGPPQLSRFCRIFSSLQLRLGSQ